MPLFDLRQDSRTLDPLAPFKVLAVMCHPNDRLQREKMMGTIQQETGEEKPRRRPFTSREFFEEVRRLSRRGAVAGGLLMTILQLQASGYKPSLNRAIPLVTASLPRWVQPQSPYWSKDRSEHLTQPRRRWSPPELPCLARGKVLVSEATRCRATGSASVERSKRSLRGMAQDQTHPPLLQAAA
jgi:hypothetical protein